MDYTHILMEYTGYKVGLNENQILNGGNKETVQHFVILTFDKNDICVNARQMISGYKEEELQTVYEWYINNWVKSTTNIKIENGKLYMNENRYLGNRRNDGLLHHQPAGC